MNREHLIQRYEHNYSGWVVTAKRRGKRFRRFFSDQPKGRRNALRAARDFRDKLVAHLPRPTKIKRTDIRNSTGIIGVARVKERTHSGKVFVRYVASWLKHNGERGKASFSVGLYGEKEAFRLASCARRATLQELKLAEFRTNTLDNRRNCRHIPC